LDNLHFALLTLDYPMMIATCKTY